MIITPIKTDRITARAASLLAVLDGSLENFADGSILVVTSKIVSLCEGSVVPVGSVSKQDLVAREADLYTEAAGPYGFHFTVTKNTLIPSAGIDESNSGDVYVLWPRDAQATANQVREYLVERFGVKQAGVIITDSTCSPLRRGTTGISLAHSGFQALRDYIGKPDLFGRPFSVSVANVSGGLAAAAVMTMGEGAEQTPLCLIQDASVTFTDQNPDPEELAALNIPVEEDIFAPFLQGVTWEKGRHGKTSA